MDPGEGGRAPGALLMLRFMVPAGSKYDIQSQKLSNALP
jgi:hypothetical protein